MVKLMLALIVGLYIPIIDTIDMLIRMGYRYKFTYRRKQVLPTSVAVAVAQKTVNPYKILMSVHNLAGQFEEFKNNIKVFGYENVLVIDDTSTDNTVALLQQEGIPVLPNQNNWQKPNSILRGLRALPPETNTVIVMDPDARILNLNPKEYGKEISDFKEVLLDFQASDYDACAVRVLAQCDSVLESLQNFEYKISMGLTKKSMGANSTVSGAFAFYKRYYLEDTLLKHSRSVYGEDYEISLRILSSGGRIYYDGRLTVLTKQRATLFDLTRQRMGWDFSLLKIDTMISGRLLDLPRKFYTMYHYIFYNVILSVLLHPIRVLSITVLLVCLVNLFDNLAHTHMIPDYPITNPMLFFLFYVFSLMVTYALLVVVERRRRGRYIFILLLFPFYSLYMGLVPRTLGFLNYITIKTMGFKLVEDGYKYT